MYKEKWALSINGFFILDSILVIVGSLILIAGIFHQNSVRQNDLKFENFKNSHNTIVVAIHEIGSARSDYFISGNDWNGALGAAQAIPVGMTNAGAPNVFTNAFGGTLTITPQEFQGPSSGGSFPGIPLVQMTYTDIPKKSCVRFASSIAPESYDFKVNGTRVLLKSQPDLSYVDIASASAACNQVVNNIDVTSVRQIAYSERENIAIYTCPTSFLIRGNTCIQMSASLTPATVNYTCPVGQTLAGANCQQTDITSAIYSPSSPDGYVCQTGYILTGHQNAINAGGGIYSPGIVGYCVKTILNQANQYNTCPSGQFLNGSFCNQQTLIQVPATVQSSITDELLREKYKNLFAIRSAWH